MIPYEKNASPCKNEPKRTTQDGSEKLFPVRVLHRPPFTPDPEKGQGFLLFAAKIEVYTGKTGLFLRDRGSASKMNGLHKTAEIPLFPYRSLT